MFFKSKKNEVLIAPASEVSAGSDCIHFLSTGASDAILIESTGRFALVDCAEDSDNPRGFKWLDYEGYEDKVLDYLKAHAADENGIVNLDFIVGTHSHSDHIGGFDTIIADPSVHIGRAYLKEYDESKINNYEINEWDNKEVYVQMLNALNARNIPVISKPDNTPFTFGNFTVTFFNTEDNDKKRVGENDRSLGLLLKKGSTKIFLAGDINNVNGDEKRLAPQIGKVNLLKVGHHSYAGSTSRIWLKILKPDVCIVTNHPKFTDKRTLFRIKRIAGSQILITGRENGIIAEAGSDGKIKYYNNIHK